MIGLSRVGCTSNRIQTQGTATGHQTNASLHDKCNTAAQDIIHDYGDFREGEEVVITDMTNSL